MSFIPNTTPTPNWLYNGEMKKMSDTELRVVLIVTRHTLGWVENEETGMRKQEDWISHTALIDQSGRSSPAISKAVDVCIKHGWVEARDKEGNLLETAEQRRRRRIFYRLGSIFTDKLKSTKESKVDGNLPNLTRESTKVNEGNLPKKLRNTKETLTKETILNKYNNITLETLSEEDLTSLKEKFPTIDVLAQRETAVDWLKSTGKTYKDYLAFFRNWLRRAATQPLNKTVSQPSFVGKEYDGGKYGHLIN